MACRDGHRALPTQQLSADLEAVEVPVWPPVAGVAMNGKGADSALRFVVGGATITTFALPGGRSVPLEQMRRNRADPALSPASACAYQLVAVDGSISPIDASQRSASIAALQPSPAAVTACR